jgi:allantoinase
MLKTHGRYPFSPITDRKPWDWPEGKRLALYIAVNIEHFPFGEGMGVPLAHAQPEPDVVNFSWRDYGNRIGVWRLLELFDELKLPAAALANASIYEHAPQIMAAFRKRGDEVVGHGRTNAERQGPMSEAEERVLIEEATAILARHEGQKPAGWMGPWVSESKVTPDLLQEAGYQYLMDWGHDDQPVWLKTRGGRILSVPYPKPTNDLPAMHGHSATPAQWADMLIDYFDEMLHQSRHSALVCCLSLHPFLVGFPGRLRQLRRALEHIAARRDRMWIAHPGAIARHAAGLPPGLIV